MVSAYVVLVERGGEAGPGYFSYDVGSGRPVTIRHFVELMRSLSGSSTLPEYGALAYRPHEVMHSCADVSALEALGWRPAVPLDEGVRRLLDAERVALARGADCA